MFAIKVMNPQDNDYAMYSASSYRIKRLYGLPDANNNQEHSTTLIINLTVEVDSEIHPIEANSTIYVMNQDGKTIDTIRA